MEAPKTSDLAKRLFSARVIATSLPFALAAALLIKAGFLIPVSGTTMVMDPREIFVMLGCAFTGPVGAAIIAFFVGLVDPVASIRYISVFYHFIAGLWVCFSYRALLRRQPRLPLLIIGWIFIVLAAYYVVMGPAAWLASQFTPALPEEVFEGRQSWDAVVFWLRNVVPEALAVSAVTAFVIGLLPRKFRQPLW